ncbi:hypothetical protein PanWU01x14_163800 [Parasponia andersonii]|uniref:Uncharacterized protein n=1 Tax=Parasponia andersonii TaxID=3476 RepID=A0A2P5CCY0_PARAD|nr:hypothetical protein PanWU01x14_163800 [Parasponia andersonii]
MFSVEHPNVDRDEYVDAEVGNLYNDVADSEYGEQDDEGIIKLLVRRVKMEIRSVRTVMVNGVVIHDDCDLKDPNGNIPRLIPQYKRE